ncbi:hypothetical protein MHYP_G00201130 [Metynnis hypsauchen]
MVERVWRGGAATPSHLFVPQQTVKLLVADSDSQQDLGLLKRQHSMFALASAEGWSCGLLRLGGVNMTLGFLFPPVILDNPASWALISELLASTSHEPILTQEMRAFQPITAQKWKRFQPIRVPRGGACRNTGGRVHGIAECRGYLA